MSERSALMLSPQEWARIRDHVLSRQSYAFEKLAELIRIPTVAHTSRPNPALAECADLLASWLTRLGSTDARVFTPAVNPLVTGSVGHEPGKPTLLVYGHYDVQDPGPLDAWRHPPFEPVIEDGRIFARGSGDNKGQFLAHLLAIETYQALGIDLPLNFRFIFDGGEEIGSGDLAAFAATTPEELQADYAFTSDGPVHESWRPTLVLGGRGIVYFHVRLRTMRRPTHSQYAPVLPNAAWHALEVLGSMRDRSGRVTIPGFYDDVLPPSEADLALLRNIPPVIEDVRRDLQPEPFGDMTPETYYRRLLMEPYLNIAGFAAGDLTGSQTVVPSEAIVKLDIGLVPNQRSETVAEQVRDYLAERGIDPTDVELMFSMEPSRTSPEHPLVGAITSALERVWEKPAVVMNRFSSYSPYYVFDQLGVPGFYVAYAQPDQSNHAPNENLSLEYFMNGILSSAAIFDAIGASPRTLPL
jgi:acetylornithine deacetylase/succinyl-diaminopimelate desuccinylase-like protein